MGRIRKRIDIGLQAAIMLIGNPLASIHDQRLSIDGRGVALMQNAGQAAAHAPEKRLLISRMGTGRSSSRKQLIKIGRDTSELQSR